MINLLEEIFRKFDEDHPGIVDIILVAAVVAMQQSGVGWV